MAGRPGAVLGKPLWVLSAGAGMGVVLGMTVWAGTALATGSGTTTPSALQSQITALQRRMAQDEATINGLQSLLSGVTRSRGGSTLVIAGEAASVSGGRGNFALGNSASVSGGLDNAARGNNDSILGGANEVIGTAVRCGFFRVSPAMSHCYGHAIPVS